MPSENRPSLAEDISQDADFVLALRDDDFACALQGLLLSGDFIRESDGLWWGANSDDETGELVAKLRNNGERFDDFYQGGVFRYEQPTKNAYESVHQHLKRLGWRKATAEDYTKAQVDWQEAFEVLLKAMNRFALREKAVPHEWTEPLNWKLKNAISLMALKGRDEKHATLIRLMELALDGRISEDEYYSGDTLLYGVTKPGP